jgi:hypothetical protein
MRGASFEYCRTKRLTILMFAPMRNATAALGGLYQACPSVSKIVLASASSARLPAQTTNWNA